MLLRHLLWPAVLALWWAPPGAADAPPVLALAESVQPPVWLERAGTKTALAAGLPLRAGDQFSTGAGGRLHIALHDRSVIKLGENGQLSLPRLELKTQDDGTGAWLSSALQISRGAFRFSAYPSNHPGDPPRRHELDVNIGTTLMAGILGTDIWGESSEHHDLLCLLEGRIEIRSPGPDPQQMDQVGTFYAVPRGQAPRPVAPLPASTREHQLARTELKPAAAALTAAGSYLVGLESHEDADSAHAAVQKFGELGYATEVIRVRIGDRTWYRVVVNGLATATDARAFAAQIRKPLQLQSPWVMAPANL